MRERDTGGTALPTVSVVIPTRNRRRSLERTLTALWEEPGLHEVIVVDDASGDDTPDFLVQTAHEHPILRTLQTAGIGSSPARAAGAARATGEVVLFIDDDEVPVPGFVAGHAAHHAKDERIVVCGYYPVVFTGRPSAVMRLMARWWEEAFDAVEAHPEHGLFRFWGGNFSLRREELDRIPLSVPEFVGRRHEDQDFGLRCHRAGLGYAFDRALRADHFYTRTLQQFRADARNSGYATVLVHALREDLVGPVPAELVGSDKPVLDRLLSLTDRPRWYRLTTSTLAGLVRLCDGIRIHRAGESTVRLLHRIERRRGARECLAELPDTVGSSPDDAERTLRLRRSPGRAT